MTLRDDYEHWARHSARVKGEGWGIYLDAVRNGLFDTHRWEDLRFPANGARLDSASGRLDYNYTGCGVEFATNARYTEEPLCFIAQLPHGWKAESEVRVHIHWLQEEDDDPNWLLEYELLENGAAPAGTNLLIPSTQRTFTYSAGDLVQITDFGGITMTGLGISDMVKMRLFRDTANASTLFAGADTYSVGSLLYELDIHYQVDATGSAQEYTK